MPTSGWSSSPTAARRSSSATRTASGSCSRGGGGLVTALTGLVTHREALWIASAMTEEDVAVAREADGGPVELELDGVDYEVCLVESDPEAYDLFYNVIANPILWFIQHYLWDLSNAPDIRQEELDAWEHGYKVVNADIAEAVVRDDRGRRRAAGDAPRLPPLHLPGADPRARARTPSSITSSTSPGRSRTPGGSSPRAWREEIYRGLLANDIIGFHTTAYCRNFLDCCRELMELEVDYERGAVLHDGRETWVRAYPLGIDADRLDRAAGSDEVAELRGGAARRRRDHLIIRVDRADLSKNVLRGFTAFDTFLTAAPRVPRAGHLHRPPAALAPGRPRVRGVPRADRGAGRRRQPPPRHHRLDADRPADLRELPRGGRPLQALRPADGQLDLRRHEPGRQGGAGGQHPRRRRDALREHRLPRGARRLHADRQPVRHPGAGRRDPPRADDERRGARACAPSGCARSSASAIPGVWIDEQLADIRAKREQSPPDSALRRLAEAELLLGAGRAAPGSARLAPARGAPGRAARRRGDRGRGRRRLGDGWRRRGRRADVSVATTGRRCSCAGGAPPVARGRQGGREGSSRRWLPALAAAGSEARPPGAPVAPASGRRPRAAARLGRGAAAPARRRRAGAATTPPARRPTFRHLIRAPLIRRLQARQSVAPPRSAGSPRHLAIVTRRHEHA